jgi:hypothetical protein
MAFALVGLATGMGARYPRFSADNATQVAGSPGGVAYMIAAVSYIIAMIALLGWASSVYLWHMIRGRTPGTNDLILISVCFFTAGVLSLWMWLWGMDSGVKALHDLDN